MKRNGRLVYICAWVACAMVLFSSCGNKDNRLARAIEGSWLLDMPVGSNNSIIGPAYMLQFTKHKKKVDDGFDGLYVETQKVVYQVSKGDSIFVRYYLFGTVEGKWKIENGILYRKLDENTLKVSLNNFSALKDNDESLSQSEQNELKEEYKKAMCPDFYRDLYEDYQKGSKNDGFKSVIEIDGDVMIFNGLPLSRMGEGEEREFNWKIN